jgi:hypothetical protein
MEKLLRRILNNLLEKCKMGKINNTSTYALSAPVVATDIVIGSALGAGGDTKNFLMSDISAYVLGSSSLNTVCLVGSSTTTGITVAGVTTLNGSLDVNSTADVSNTLTLSKPSGTGLQVTANAIVSGTLTVSSPLDVNSTADVSNTLTLSKPTGTGLQVDANATIDGILSLTRTGGNGLSVTEGVDIGGGIDCYGLHHQWGALTVESTATFNNKIVLNGSAPATATSTGEVGQIAVDTGYIYVCTATDTWKRVAIATW